MGDETLNKEVLASVKADLIEKAVAELLDSAWGMYDERKKIGWRAIVYAGGAAICALALWLFSNDSYWILPSILAGWIALRGLEAHSQLSGRQIAIAELSEALRKCGLELHSAGSRRSIQFTYMALTDFKRVQRMARLISEA